MNPNVRGPVVDLGEMMAAKQAEAAVAAGASYVVALNQQNLQDVLMRSMQYPVLLLATSAAANAAQFVADISELVNAAQGRFVLGIVDIDAEPQIAQALQIQAVPAMFVVLSGQTGILFQGTKSKQELAQVLDELAQVAAQNGIMGHAEPFVPQLAEGEADPRFAAADAAIEAGDYALAEQEFAKVLESFPDDVEAQAGKAQAALLTRTVGQPGFDADSVMATASTEGGSAAQLAAADVEMVIGQPEAAFTRLVQLVRDTTGDERNTVRLRLLELFDTLGNAEPLVQKFRRELMTALF